MAICTKAQVKEFLGIDNTDYDTLFDNLIDRIEEFVSVYCNRDFTQSEYTEYHNGGVKRIMVKVPPIDDSETVQIWNDPNREFESSDLVDSDYYTIDYESGIVMFDYKLLSGWNSVKITYTGGYSTYPLDLVQVAIELVANKYKEGIKGSLGVPTRSLADGSVTYSLMDLLPWQRLVLDNYRLEGIRW